MLQVARRDVVVLRFFRVIQRSTIFLPHVACQTDVVIGQLGPHSGHVHADARVHHVVTRVRIVGNHVIQVIVSAVDGKVVVRLGHMRTFLVFARRIIGSLHARAMVKVEVAGMPHVLIHCVIYLFDFQQRKVQQRAHPLRRIGQIKVVSPVGCRVFRCIIVHAIRIHHDIRALEQSVKDMVGHKEM